LQSLIRNFADHPPLGTSRNNVNETYLERSQWGVEQSADRSRVAYHPKTVGNHISNIFNKL
jgi:hypothetical protein